MQDIFYIVLLSGGSFVALFFLTKLMGYRQISQMTAFDYINGITIGSIAAELATSLEDDPMRPITAMVVYALGIVLFSFLSTKSIHMRRFLVGKPIILLNKGMLYEKNLRKAKIDLNEFLMQCRSSGYFDISKLETAVLEPDGKISILPLSTDRPLTPADMNITVTQETLCANLIIDGKLMSENLRHTGKDETWLRHQLQAQGCSTYSMVLLATVDLQNHLTVYQKNQDTRNSDILI